MNRKNVSIAIIFLIGILTFNSCKKGENDPFISLRSRDARITGEWKLTGFSQTNVQYNPYSQTTTTTTQTLNGTNLTVTSGSSSETYVYSYEMTIEKDGAFSMVEIADGDKKEETGNWFWLNSGKDKTYISLGSNQFYVDQLKNSELVLVLNLTSKETDSNGLVASNSSSTSTLTFTKK